MAFREAYKELSAGEISLFREFEKIKLKLVKNNYNHVFNVQLKKKMQDNKQRHNFLS